MPTSQNLMSLLQLFVLSINRSLLIVLGPDLLQKISLVVVFFCCLVVLHWYNLVISSLAVNVCLLRIVGMESNSLNLTNLRAYERCNNVHIHEVVLVFQSSEIYLLCQKLSYAFDFI